ncbi:response regulator [Croceicoccus hydrothermalis]|uniref:response regulator n=1 Tax=Croceicoccus hydrothermalis TaxID=2867964 RepID=UPI00308414AD
MTPAEPARARLPIRGRDGIWLAVAAVLSGMMLQMASGQWLLTSVYLGGVAVMFGILWVVLPRISARFSMAEADSLDVEDWSVTAAAIEWPDVAMAITNRQGRIVCANARYGEWFGFDDATPGGPFERGDAERLPQAVKDAWRSGEASLDRLVRRNGRWNLKLARAGRGEDYLIWTFTPVASENQVAEVVRHLRGRVGRALGAAGIQAAAVTPDGTILGANDAFAARATGRADGSTTGRDFVDFLTGDEYERYFYAREGEDGEPLTLVHLPIADPDIAPGDIPDLPPTLFLILNSGPRASAVSSLPDIEALMSLLPLGLAMADRDGRFLFVNRAFRRAVALDEKVETPSFPAELVVHEDKSALADAVRRHAAGTPGSAKVPVRLETMPEETVSISLASVRGLGDAAVMLSLKDSTEETRLKRQVAQATKMQAVGQLAGGVAHDFNNVLTAIIGYCDLMLLRHTPGDIDYDDIQQIKANSNRAASLTRQLLAFSRQQTLRPQTLQLPDVISEVSVLLKRLIGEKIRLVVTHDRALGPVRADPGQLEQVIVNLAVNARDAMLAKSDGGTLKISTHRIGPAEVHELNNDILPKGHYTALCVADTGGGIPVDKLGKIFEPFYTTKETGKGTGLGLSTVYGIVKQSGGYIFADSPPGGGAQFTVYLPVHTVQPGEIAAEQNAKPAKEPESAVSFGGNGAILLVEDEHTVRAVAERALKRQGYEVTCAADGEEGLEIIARDGGFDLVVSDVVMPTMDGPAMVREIRKQYPHIPVIFMSGYAEEQLRREIDIAGMYFLAKPFSVAQIGEQVARVLARAREGGGAGAQNSPIE